MIEKIAELDLRLKGATGMDKIHLLFSKVFFGNVMETDDLRGIAKDVSDELSSLRSVEVNCDNKDQLQVCYIVLEVLHVFISYREGAASVTADHLKECKARLKDLDAEWYHRVNHFMADHYRHLGHYHKALECYHDSVNVGRKDEAHKCYVLNNLGSIYLELGAFEEALRCFEYVIQFGGIKPDVKRIYLLIKMAKAHRGLGQHSIDRNYLEEAGRLAQLEGNRFLVCVVRFQMAHCLRIGGFYAQALHEAQTALRIAMHMNDEVLLPVCYFANGLVLSDENYADHDFKKSEELLLNALDLFKRGGRKPRVMQVCYALADTYEAYNCPDKALQCFREAVRLDKELHTPALICTISKLKIQLDLQKDQETVEIKSRELSQVHKKNVLLQQIIQEKNELMSTAAHDLKNPLTAIRGIADLLYHAPELEEKQQVLKMLDNLRNCATDTFEIVTNILDMNRLEDSGMHAQLLPCALSPIVNETIRLFKDRFQGKGISLTFTDKVGQTLALVDPFMYKQMLSNLISNALKYSDSGTSVEVILKTTVDGKRIESCIKDEGLGIPENEQGLLFDRHASISNKPTGGEHSSGLGLSITKRFAEINRGAVTCESTPGKGSTFILSLRTA